MIQQRSDSGFTAVELLITLFVAAAFLIAGFQLFNVVIRDGGNARAESRAGNVAYDYLRRYASSATNPCRASTPLVASPIDISGLADTKITVLVSCPPYSVTNLSKVETIIQYNNPQKIVKYSMYTTGSQPSSDSTLIGWWPLNGNAHDNSGYNNPGTIANALSTANRSNQRDSAYSFNGTTAYINAGSAVSRPTTAFTTSAWIKPTNYVAAAHQSIVSRQQGGGYIIRINNSATGSCQSKLAATVYVNGAYSLVCESGPTVLSNGQWVMVALVYDGAAMKLYVDGIEAGATSVSGAMTYGDAHVPFCIGSEADATTCDVEQFFNGTIDDVRAYSRALTAAEVLALYQAGPQ